MYGASAVHVGFRRSDNPSLNQLKIPLFSTMFRVFALDFQSEHAHLFESSMITESKMADFRKNH